jgi:hypothetical protein
MGGYMDTIYIGCSTGESTFRWVLRGGDGARVYLALPSWRGVTRCLPFTAIAANAVRRELSFCIVVSDGLVHSHLGIIVCRLIWFMDDIECHGRLSLLELLERPQKTKPLLEVDRALGKMEKGSKRQESCRPTYVTGDLGARGHLIDGPPRCQSRAAWRAVGQHWLILSRSGIW